MYEAMQRVSSVKHAQGSDAREMVMMSLVHEHNRGGQSNVVKRARMHAQPPGAPIQPVFTGGTPLEPLQAIRGRLILEG